MYDLFPRCAGAPYPSGAPLVWTWRRCSAPLLDRMREAQGGRREGRRRGHWPRRWPYSVPRLEGLAVSGLAGPGPGSGLVPGRWLLAPGPSKAGRSCIVSGPGGWPPLRIRRPAPGYRRRRLRPPLLAWSWLDMGEAGPGVIPAAFLLTRRGARPGYALARLYISIYSLYSLYIFRSGYSTVCIYYWLYYFMHILLHKT